MCIYRNELLKGVVLPAGQKGLHPQGHGWGKGGKGGSSAWLQLTLITATIVAEL